MSASECKIRACRKPGTRRGMCEAHYSRVNNAERTIARGGKLQPPKNLGLRILASTCRRCGDLVTTPDHLLRTSVGKKARCSRCSSEKAVEYEQRRSAVDPDYRERRLVAERELSRKNFANRQRESAKHAPRRGMPWTGPELEIVARDDLTTEQMASMLGRTFAATQEARRRVRVDPKFSILMGEAL